MNMISTGAFLPETDASTKQSELVKKLTSAWEKKNSKTARAGGASLMALSLAACGGEDNTPFSAADVSAAEAAATTAALTGADGTVYASVDAAVTSNDTAIADAARAEGVASVDITTDNQAAIDAAVAAVDLTTDNAAATDAAVAAASSFSSLADLVAAYDAAVAPEAAATIALTDDDAASTGADILEAEMTSSDDTITATGTVAGGSGTLDDTDIIADPSTTDNDTLTVTIAHGNATTEGPTSITNVENIIYNDMNFATLSNIDLGGISGANVTVNNAQAGTAVTGMQVNTVGTGMTINAGTGVTGTMTVGMAAGSDAVVNTNGASAVSVTAGAATDTITVNISDDINIVADVATTLAISTSVDATATFTGDIEELTTINASGAGALTLVSTASDTIAAFTNATVTGVAKVSTGGGNATLTGVDAATVIEIDDATASSLTLGAAANIQIEATGQALTIDYSDGTSTDATTSATVVVDDNLATNAGLAAVDIVVDDADSTDNITTLNVVLNEDVTSLNFQSAGGADTNGDGTATEYGAVSYVVTGAGDATLDATSNLQGTLDASGMTGNLEATVQAGFLTVTTGSGADTINIGTTALAYVLDGGTGTDTLAASGAVDLSNSTLSGFEVLSGNVNFTFAGSQLAGATYSTSTGAFVVDVIDTADLDFSGLTIGDTTNDGVTVTAVYGGSLTSASAVTIEGSAGADSFTTGAGNDVINGGDGVDTIVGGDGLNVLSGGAGADSITGGANADTINGGSGGDTLLAGGGGADTIDGGTGGDTITGGGGADTIIGGEGADDITGGGGADTIDLTETTAAIDDVDIDVYSTDGFDTLIGFDVISTASDTISFLAADNYNDLTSSDVSSSATVVAAATAAILLDNATNSTNAQNDAIAFQWDGKVFVAIQTDGDAAAFDTTADAIVCLGAGFDASDLVVGDFVA